MRYLLLIVSALWLIARAVAHAIRPRRFTRVRPYANPGPAGPVTLILPSSTTGTVCPPLPAVRPLPWEPAPVVALSTAPHSPGQRARSARSRRGVVFLLAISHPVSVDRVAVAA